MTASSSPPNESFPLAPSGDLPDPATHAWRKDLADVALAGRVIASHYAAPVMRTLETDTILHIDPDSASDAMAKLVAGDPFELLDSRGGWAWGYGGKDRRVGYISASALA